MSCSLETEEIMNRYFQVSSESFEKFRKKIRQVHCCMKSSIKEKKTEGKNQVYFQFQKRCQQNSDQRERFKNGQLAIFQRIIFSYAFKG